MLPTPIDLVFTEKLKLSFLASQMPVTIKEKAGLFTDIFSMMVENSQHKKSSSFLPILTFHDEN